MSFQFANRDLEKAESEGSEWRDAGMISLGFFRVLEQEFNERLIIPTARALDLPSLAILLERLKNSAATQRDIRAAEFWTQTLKKLQSAKSDGRGMELGPLYFLLGKIRGTKGADHELRSAVASAVRSRLTGMGLTALETGELAELVAEEPREKFRNPAAHNRFVDLATAREAKAYVEAALKKLIDFTRPASELSQTLH
jgi:hypothetical protein